jgi:hypothetical protein
MNKSRINLEALIDLSKINPGGVRELVKTLGRFHGTIAQLEIARMRKGDYYNETRGNNTKIKYQTVNDLEEKIETTKSVICSTLRALNNLAKNHGFRPVIPSGLTREQIAAEALKLVEDVVHEGDYKEYFK